MALGRITVDDIPAMVEVGPTYEPDPSVAAVYEELYGEFVNLYKQTKEHPPAAQPALTGRGGCRQRHRGRRPVQMRSKFRASSQSVTV